MSANYLTVQQSLHTIISNPSFDAFTVVQLRNKYLTATKENLDPKAARTFVYGQIRRFCKQGLLKKVEGKNSRLATYFKTAKFHNATFKINGLDKSPNLSNAQKEISDVDIGVLEEQLKKYNVDLLASIGESEEYKRLYETTPNLKDILESNYHQSREQSSKLLGQIKALKTVLSHLR